MPRRKLLTSVAVILVAISGFLADMPGFAASTEKVLYSFKNDGKDGQMPTTSLIFDGDGNLYGTTSWGGSSGKGCSGVGCGTVFRLAPQTNGTWSEAALYSFRDNGTDGHEPVAGLVRDSDGNLFGTTLLGGTYGYGTAFQVKPGSGGRWTETVLHSFNFDHTDGFYPYASLIFDTTGRLYGTTEMGGNHGGTGAGTVFQLTPGSGGKWTEAVLYSFGSNSPDGGLPRASLIFDAHGSLYGTVSNAAIRGGKAVAFVFKLTSKSGTWSEKMLYGCKIQGCPNNGVGAYGNVIFDRAGNLYSTTAQGGAYNRGVVFQLTPQRNGKWTETVIHSFGSGKGQGGAPLAGLVRDAAGHMYGTTEGGGAYNGGSVFRLTYTSGKWAYKVIHSFGKSKDGALPQAGLILDPAGHLYGTTAFGGTHNSGTVFEITP